MRKIAPLLLLTGTLAGCGAVANRSPEPPPHVEVPVTLVDPAPAELPASSLTPELLFEVLLAEIAAQRGDLVTSASHYLAIATETRDPGAARQATRLAAVARRLDLAAQAAGVWVELAPTEPSARHSLSALLIQQQRTEEALPHLREYMALSQKGERTAYADVAKLLSEDSNKVRALVAMERLLGGDEHPAALRAHAELARLSGEGERALELVNRALSGDADAVPALILRAEIHSGAARHGEAAEDLRRALALNTEDHHLRLRYARELVVAGDLEEARVQFRTLADALPDSGELIYAQGLLALQAGDEVAAKAFFRNLVVLGQRVEEAAYSLGQMAEVEQAFQEAVDWYSEVAGGELFFEAQLRIGVLMGKLEGLEAAREHLHGIPVETPAEELRLTLVEGEILRDHREHAQAMVVYEEALERFPDNPELLYAHALTAERVDRIDLLESNLRAILEKDPENAQALNALGYTLADRTERFEEAFELIGRALILMPDDPAILDSMGWVLHRMGRYEEALTYLQQAFDHLVDGEIAAHLGATLWMLDRRDEAQTVWQRALEVAPEDEVLLRTLQQFLE